MQHFTGGQKPLLLRREGPRERLSNTSKAGVWWQEAERTAEYFAIFNQSRAWGLKTEPPSSTKGHATARDLHDALARCAWATQHDEDMSCHHLQDPAGVIAGTYDKTSEFISAQKGNYLALAFNVTRREQRWRQYHPEDAVVIDIGANMGLFALWMSPQIGSGTICCVEPTSAYDTLSENVRRNNLSNVQTIRCAAGHPMPLRKRECCVLTLV